MQLAKTTAFAFLSAALLLGCGDGTSLFSKPTETGGSSGSSAGSGAGAGSPGSDAGGKGNSAGSATAGGSSEGGAQSSGGGGSGGSGDIATAGCNAQPSAAPPATWVNATGNLANMATECGNLGLVSAQPCSKRVIAGVAKAGLWETIDGGQTWTKLGSGAGSAEITNRISAIVYDPLDSQTFWESGIYNGGGVYKTTDNGATFEQLGEISHCDSVSVDLEDPERKTLIAGAHENNTPLHYSKDGGKSWSNIANGLPEGHCTSTLVLDATTFLVGCNSGSIMRTTNAGTSWEPVPGATGGGTFQPLLATDGTIYWPGSGGAVWLSSNHGQSFSQSATADEAPNLVAPAQFAELPDGRIVIVGKDHLLISNDHGESWAELGEALPYPGGGYDGVRGVAYSAQTKTFFIWRWDCQDVVPGDAIMSAGFDWEAE